MDRRLKNILLSALVVAHDLVTKETKVNLGIGLTNTKGGETTRMDKVLEDALIEVFSKELPEAQVFSEECGLVPRDNTFKDPTYLVSFDPLDGTTNYTIGKGLLRYGTMIAIYKIPQSKVIRLHDVVVAGMIEHTTKNVFIYENGVTTHIGHGIPKITNFTERKRVGFYDLYFVQSWDFGKALIKTMKVRETGSQAGNLLMFLVGISQFCGGPRVAPEEIGTVYALVKGAGGKVTTQTGEDAGTLIFGTTSNDRYNIIAGNEKAIDAITQCLRTQA
jgi:fructose-1,6-bisphosphatase/inositol monophosphatase family enzyme